MVEIQKVENQSQPQKVVLFDLTPLKRLIENRKNLIVNINGVYEITRPLALELLKVLREQALTSGVALREKTEILALTDNIAIVEVRIKGYLFKDKEGNLIEENRQPVIFEISEIGEASKEEKGKEKTFIRVAYTRALKRALERLVGEDFINQVILSIYPEEKKATEKQKEFIKKLLKTTKISEETKEKILKNLDNLTLEQANKIIEKLKLKS